MIIHYLDSPCGSGKTLAIIDRAADIISSGLNVRKSVLVVQPRKGLISQTKKELAKRHPHVPVEAIHGDVTNRVVGKVLNHLQMPNPEPHVLFITWATFVQLSNAFRKENWILIVDEIPSVIRCFDKPLKNEHGIITKYLQAVSKGPSYSELVAGDPGKIRELAENRTRDGIREYVQDLAITIHSPHWETYVLTNQYHGLLNGGGVNPRLTAFSTMKETIFEGYASVLIAGADFEESLLYKIWSQKGVVFVEDVELAKGLLYGVHENGSLLTIGYFDGRDFSKCIRDRNGVLEELVAATKTAFGKKRFLWSANRDQEDQDLFDGVTNAKYLPPCSHGLNSFQKYHNFAYLAANNLIPSHLSFLEEWYGLSSEEIRTAIDWQQFYQSALRTSLRDRSNKEPKLVLTFGMGAATWLQGRFPGSTLTKLDSKIQKLAPGRPVGRPRKSDDDNERKRQWEKERREKCLKQIEAIRASTELAPDAYASLIGVGNGSNKSQQDETTNKKGTSVLQYQGSIWAHKGSRYLDGILDQCSITEFELDLKILSKEEVASKEDTKLISPAFFDKALSPDTFRAEKNIRFLSGIWLDNDGGGISPDEFAALLPHIRMTIYATYSSTRDCLRYRVYIPIDEYVSADIYRIIVHQVMKKLSDAGYVLEKPIANDPRRAHGFDPASLVPTALHRLPCKPADSKGTFFKTYGRKERSPLNVNDWIEHGTMGEPPIEAHSVKTFSRQGVDAERVAKAHETLMSGKIGNGPHFNYMQELAVAGLTLEEVRQAGLETAQQASSAKSRNERRDNVPRAIKWLEKEGFFRRSEQQALEDA